MTVSSTSFTPFTRFTKMQALGNDFVVLDTINRKQSDGRFPQITPERAIALCDRRTGVGADQILLLVPPKNRSADVGVKIWNSDGSRAGQCGNGLRAVALYLSRRNKKKTIQIESPSGLHRAVLGKDGQIEVDLGTPKLKAGFPKDGEVLNLEGENLRYFEVDVGNPHAVLYINEESRDILHDIGETLGPQISEYPRFKNGINVEFVLVEGEHRIRTCVWERGAGLTQACGSGASAAAVASIATGRVKTPVEVHLPGGALEVHWDIGEKKSIILKGPAQEVYTGEIEIR